METLVYDGTFEGFLGIIKFLIENETLFKKVKIVNQRLNPACRNVLFAKEIIANLKEVRFFKMFLKEILSKDLYNKLFLYYLCDTLELEKTVANIILKVKKNPKAYLDLTDSEVIKLYRAERAFYRERHRFYGLLRFIEIDEGKLLACFAPKFNVLPKLYPHFVKRFPNEKFAILDSLRKLMFIYFKGRYELLLVDGIDIRVNNKLDNMALLWKNYFNEIAIPERKSYIRQRNRLPLRLRTFLTEFET